ncbi:glycosyltransferase family 4 protein, partial [candidate division KSB1 bacterium]|nr:glycosyltransferase family 4 protein [candidate division KSB1 bacterium]
QGNNWDPGVGERGAWGNPQGIAKYIFWIEKKYFKCFDLIYAVAQYLVDMVHQHVTINPQKIRMIHNGVKIEELQCVDYTDIKAQLNIHRLIFTGQRFVKYKGLPTLIEACLPILEPMDVHLVIAGYGPEEKALKKMANDNPRIHFPGNLTWEDAMRYTCSADVYVLPTLVDKTPNSLMEALALATPCITTDIDGVKEMIGPGGGILIPPENATILREKIVWLLEHPIEAHEMGKKGREFVYQNFRWEDTREKIKALYFELVTNSGIKHNLQQQN